MNAENAADNLTGYTLPGGWRVRDKVIRRPDDTGGRFSISYVVERDGQAGFCKVLNYAWLMKAGPGADPTGKLQEATARYNFERDIAQACVRMSRIVTAIADGTTQISGFKYDLVSYIIFEMADKDARRLLNDTAFVDTAVKLGLLHDLAVAIRQLHTQRISHQDIKPSNVLVFDAGSTSQSGKLADLGRVVAAGTAGPYDSLPFAGDQAYAPPEVFYRAVQPKFEQSRLAADLYMLGGMISYCFTAFPINVYLDAELDPTYGPQNWTGTYGEVLPYLRDAMGRAIQTILTSVPSVISGDVRSLLLQLCEPDPCRRGDERRVGRVGQYSLERFVAKLDLLEMRALREGARA